MRPIIQKPLDKIIVTSVIPGGLFDSFAPSKTTVSRIYLSCMPFTGSNNQPIRIPSRSSSSFCLIPIWRFSVSKFALKGTTLIRRQNPSVLSSVRGRWFISIQILKCGLNVNCSLWRRAAVSVSPPVSLLSSASFNLAFPSSSDATATDTLEKSNLFQCADPMFVTLHKLVDVSCPSVSADNIQNDFHESAFAVTPLTMCHKQNLLFRASRNRIAKSSLHPCNQFSHHRTPDPEMI